MNKMTLIGLDLAKSVFQVHGVDAEGHAVLKQRLTRAQMAVFLDLLQEFGLAEEPGALGELRQRSRTAGQ